MHSLLSLAKSLVRIVHFFLNRDEPTLIHHYPKFIVRYKVRSRICHISIIIHYTKYFIYSKNLLCSTYSSLTLHPPITYNVESLLFASVYLWGDTVYYDWQPLIRSLLQIFSPSPLACLLILLILFLHRTEVLILMKPILLVILWTVSLVLYLKRHHHTLDCLGFVLCYHLKSFIFCVLNLGLGFMRVIFLLMLGWETLSPYFAYPH